MTDDEFATEPVPGLPEVPPEGERILWQGRPQPLALAWHALSLPWVAVYFVALALWRFGSLADILPLRQAVGYSMPFLILGAIVIALLFAVAWVQARATVYTITNRRVAMRVGAALTLTLNLPFTQIARADVARGRFGTGTLVFETLGDTRLSYLVLWPHLRPWRIARTQPALRCIPEPERVARLLAEAAEARLSLPRVAPAAGAAVTPAGTSAPQPQPSAMPAE